MNITTNLLTTTSWTISWTTTSSYSTTLKD